jgi:cob(I)alamin adenosyltransferase
MRIYTRTGDAGETGLFGGERVPKDAARIEACGALDELSAALGVAGVELAERGAADLTAEVLRAQERLFEVGAELAAPETSGRDERAPQGVRCPPEATAEVEALIDRLWAALPELRAFLLPGGSRPGASLHVARTVCRRAERRVTTLARAEPVSPHVLAYLNRLSDLLFVMARTANARLGIPDVVWSRQEPGAPPGNRTEQP